MYYDYRAAHSHGDLYSVELEEGAVSSACLVTWLIEDFSIGTVFMMILSTARWPCSLRDERVFTTCCVI